VLWSWVAGSESLDPLEADPARITARLAHLPEALRVYTPAFHHGCFALPAFLERLVASDHAPDEAALRAAGHPLPRSLEAS
jgi:hypothetical protein